MTAWQILIAGSSLAVGNAWQHLNAQEGGTSIVQIFGALEVEMCAKQIEAELESSEIEAAIEGEVMAELEPEIEGEI